MEEVPKRLMRASRKDINLLCLCMYLFVRKVIKTKRKGDTTAATFGMHVKQTKHYAINRKRKYSRLGFSLHHPGYGL